MNKMVLYCDELTYQYTSLCNLYHCFLLKFKSKYKEVVSVQKFITQIYTSIFCILAFLLNLYTWYII